MSKNDPTEDVLATIARIFEQSDSMKTRLSFGADPAFQRGSIIDSADPETADREMVSADAFEQAEEPTGEALADDDSALPHHDDVSGQRQAARSEAAMIGQHPIPADANEHPAALANGYFRLGPGPLDAIRFRWTARADGNGGYFVDETIGPKSRAITSGPMSEEDALAFIDLQVQEAFERFERLKQSAAEFPTPRKPLSFLQHIRAEHHARENPA